MKIINGFLVGVTVLVIVCCTITNCVYKKNLSGRYRGFFARQPKISTGWEYSIVFAVFILELIIAILAFETARQFGNNIAFNTSNPAWTFGQIVPFVMIILPLMAGLKTMFGGEAITTAQGALDISN
jgi:hypothetical protein